MTPENRRQVIILAVLAAGLIVTLYVTVFRTPTGSSTSAPLAGGTSEIATIAASVKTAFATDDVDIDSLINRIKDVKFDYEKSRLAKNPMIPLVGNKFLDSAEGEEEGAVAHFDDDELLFIAENLLLSGIIWDTQHPLAILDNQLVDPGFVFEDHGILVQEIGEQSVVLVVPQEDGPVEYIRELKEP